MTGGQQTQIGSFRQAVKHYERHTAANVEKVDSAFGGKHRSVQLDDGRRVRLMLKQSLFQSFGKVFGMDDERGDSINLRQLARCRFKGVDKIVTVLYDGRIYETDTDEWYDFATSNGTIRVPDDTDEKNASIPVSLMERVG